MLKYQKSTRLNRAKAKNKKLHNEGSLQHNNEAKHCNARQTHTARKSHEFTITAGI